MKKTLSITAGFAISALLIWLAVRKIDFRAVAGVYTRPSFAQMLGVAAILACGLFLRGLRWKLLVSPCTKVGAVQMTKLEIIGLALNNILPLRLGELGRATIGAASTGASFLTLISTIVVERVMDALTIGALFAIAVSTGSAPSLAEYAPRVWMMLGAVTVALAMLIFLEEMLENSKLLRDFLARLPRLDRFVRQIGMGAQAFRDWRLALGIIGVGIPLWLLDALGYFWAAHIINLTPAINFGKGIVLLCTAAVSVALPSAPGFFGAFELALQQVLIKWGVSASDGFAYAAFVHLNGWILVTVTGVILIYSAGHSLGGMWKHLSGGGQDTPICPAEKAAV